jgi:hypothetical protein
VSGLFPRLERDRGARHRILVVEAAARTGDAFEATERFLAELQLLGCKVTFAPAGLERREPGASRLAAAGVEVLHRPHVDSVEAYLEDHGRDFDGVVDSDPAPGTAERALEAAFAYHFREPQPPRNQ